MITIDGLVTDVEESHYTRKDGEEATSYEVYVASGRKTYRTIGSSDDGLERGDSVKLRVEPRTWKNSTEVDFLRIAVLEVGQS